MDCRPPTSGGRALIGPAGSRFRFARRRPKAALALVGLLVEKTDVAALPNLGWILLVYATVIQFCVAYVSWFAALARLPASVAAIGTMAVPVIGVVTSAVALHEPLGIGQIAALIFTLAGVVLATRS
jgi:drug/metabolite transporter (DMT)-like permease